MLGKTVILLLLTVSLTMVIATSTSQKSTRMSQNRLNAFRILIKYLTSGKFSESENDVRFLSFNILAPIRIDEKNLTDAGTDPNLLRTDVRLYVTAKTILKIKADIVYIQEIQVDTHEVLKDYLRNTYTSVGFASHGPSHWLDLPEGVTNVPNGVAIFYRKDRFVLQYVDAFQTSKSGNHAQAAIFRRRKSPSASSPILSVNVHLQHGTGFADSALRVTQGAAVHKKIEEITAKLLAEQPQKTPVVIVGGDFNSLAGFPGIEQFKKRGYTDARNTTSNSDRSIYYPEAFITDFFPPLYGLPIDTFMVPKALTDSGKVKIKSLKVANVTAEVQSESGYIMKVLGDLLSDMQMDDISNEMSAAILETLLKMISDDNDYDTLYNRAMRMGGDHVPVTATFEIEDS